MEPYYLQMPTSEPNFNSKLHWFQRYGGDPKIKIGNCWSPHTTPKGQSFI